MELVKIPELVVTYPFFCTSPKAKSVDASGNGFVIKSINSSLGMLEQDVFFACLLFLQKQDRTCVYPKDLAKALHLRDTRAIAKSLQLLNDSEYLLSLKDREYEAFKLLRVQHVGATRNKCYSFSLAEQLAEQIAHGTGETSYLQLDLQDYLRVPAGLTRRTWLYLQNKARVQKAGSRLEISADLLCTYLPIQNKETYGRNRTLTATLNQLRDIGFLSYQIANGICKIEFCSKSQIVQTCVEMPIAASRAFPAPASKADRVVILEEPSVTAESATPLVNAAAAFSNSSALETENATLKQELAEAHTKIASLDQKTQALAQELAEANAKIASLQEKTGTLAEIVSKLEKQAAETRLQKPSAQNYAQQPRQMPVPPKNNQNAKNGQQGTLNAQQNAPCYHSSQAPVEMQNNVPSGLRFASQNLVREYFLLKEAERASLLDSLLWVQDEFAEYFAKDIAPVLNRLSATHLCDQLPVTRDRWRTERLSPPQYVGKWVAKHIEQRWDGAKAEVKRKGKDDGTAPVNLPSPQEKAEREQEWQQEEAKREQGRKFLAKWEESKQQLDKNKLAEMLAQALAENQATPSYFKDGAIAISFVKKLVIMLGYQYAPSVPDCKAVWQEARKLCRNAQKEQAEAEEQEDATELAEIVKLRAKVVEQLPSMAQKLRKEDIDQLWSACGDEKAFAIEICGLAGINGQSASVVDENFAEFIAKQLVYSRR